MDNLVKKGDPQKWYVLLHFCTICATVLVAFICYMMSCRESILNDRITKLEKENSELYTMFVAESLAQGESLKRLENYRNHLIQKFSAKSK